MLKATEILRNEHGGSARNRHEVALDYRTENGHRSVGLGYAALNRAIERGEIVLRPDGSIELGPTAEGGGRDA